MIHPVPFDNSYARLPPRFYSRQAPEPVAAPAAIRFNLPLAQRLGIDAEWLQSAEGVAALAGNRLPRGAEPIAAAYAGHQFGAWNPQLGDGRAVLLGEVIAGGRRYDIQLKGSGRTPYSRMGDGRAPLGPVLREYLLSEAMAALGVPTTRALAAVATGEPVRRETALPGAVLTRVASSHIRVGTFQFFAAQGDIDAVRLLAEHVIQRHYPEAEAADNPPLAMFQAAVRRQADLVAQWQLLGFIHGVMNTDNMLLSGETVDYGPCAFMDAFNPRQVYSSIDLGGRYAYCNQPAIAHWNLACLAQTLLPLLSADEKEAAALAQAALDAFPAQFLRRHQSGLLEKLGLFADGGHDGNGREGGRTGGTGTGSGGRGNGGDGAGARAGNRGGNGSDGRPAENTASIPDEDAQLAGDWLALLAECEADFTLSFRRLADLAQPDNGTQSVQALWDFDARFQPWLARWRARCRAAPLPPAERQARMYAVNPAFIPRNHLVEEAIRAAAEADDFRPFNALVETLSDPFAYAPSLSPHAAHHATPPRPDQIVRRTFCGT